MPTLRHEPLGTNPFGEDAHGFAAGGIDLGFAPGAGFGKVEGVEDANDEINAANGADEDDTDRLAGENVGGDIRREAVGFGIVNKLLH